MIRPEIIGENMVNAAGTSNIKRATRIQTWNLPKPPIPSKMSSTFFESLEIVKVFATI